MERQKGTVVIDWEHGNDMNEVIEHKTNDVDRLLKFIFELRGWDADSHYFDDGHNYREDKFVNKLHEKWNHEFEHIVPSDNYYSNYRPAVGSVYLKFGNKIKYIVWNNVLDNRTINLPKIGSTLKTDSGQICGLGKRVFGGNDKDYIYFWDLKKMGLGYIDEEKEEGYKPIEANILDIKIDFDKKSLKDYRPDFTDFHYVILLDYNGYKMTTGMRGCDRSFLPDEDFLYYFKG